uniref:Homeobox domain-containing protein n=1 Tax=Phocoena sinus TaxID=42100 RepID=A0A8C9E0T2_PHOSS
MSSAETHDMETVSPLPSFSMDLLIQDSPDSPTSPTVKLIATAADKSTEKKEEKVLVKKQKTRTVFSQTQQCVLNDRFHRQKYLSLQQMQELSNILNLSYKQVKTWFQNQRMKCKRWQKNNWLRNSNIVTQGPATTEYPGSGRAGSAAMAHGPSCSAACGILPDRGTNPCPLHQQGDSQPLRHQGSPIPLDPLI